MLFKIIVSKTNLRKKIFGGIKRETSNIEYLVSVESETEVEEYLIQMPKEGVVVWIGMWGEERRTWKAKRSWEKVEGEDKDAHILILKSPTGVIYTKQLRYI